MSNRDQEPRVLCVLPYFVEQDLILLLHGSHERVLGQVVRSCGVLFVCTVGLLVQALDALGEEAGEIEGMAFLLGVSGTLVEKGVVQQSGASEGTLEGAGRAEGQMSILGALLLRRHLAGLLGDEVLFDSDQGIHDSQVWRRKVVLNGSMLSKTRRNGRGDIRRRQQVK